MLFAVILIAFFHFIVKIERNATVCQKRGRFRIAVRSPLKTLFTAAKLNQFAFFFSVFLDNHQILSYLGYSSAIARSHPANSLENFLHTLHQDQPEMEIEPGFIIQSIKSHQNYLHDKIILSSVRNSHHLFMLKNFCPE
ncbi:MAG: hypothetical protein C5B59_10900 [Bacteroidetes bacterium]|nr:MAG: hypothetical protein C5B59_10900 [Bacteroidota bacterium]